MPLGLLARRKTEDTPMTDVPAEQSRLLSGAIEAGASTRRPTAKTGPELRCKGWRQEGLLRMLENTLANAERPEELVIYGGTGRVARDWPSFERLEQALCDLEVNETLVVQSGRPVAKFRSFSTSPLV